MVVIIDSWNSWIGVEPGTFMRWSRTVRGKVGFLCRHIRHDDDDDHG